MTIKVAAAVIQFEDKVLLMRRAPSKKFPGFWEFPGGKAKPGERTSAALKRELDEELGVKFNIGKLITSAPFGDQEIYAYNVQYNGEEIQLRVHDAMEWVSLNEALKYSLLPADRQIVMHMTKTKEPKEKIQQNTVWEKRLTMHMSKPEYDPEKQKWVVMKIEGSSKPKTFEFDEQVAAMDFYIKEASKILQPYFYTKHDLVR